MASIQIEKVEAKKVITMAVCKIFGSEAVSGLVKIINTLQNIN